MSVRSKDLPEQAASPGNGSPPEAGSSSEEVSMREALAQLIRRMTPNEALREDLLQEAMVHLWLTETRRPGQTRSWYMQSCRFHLQHYLNSGRSIDSAKRWRDQLPLDEQLHEDEDDPTHPADSGNSVLTSVSAREILALLVPHLSAQEQKVLECLADGLGAREIGRKLDLSHTMVIRHRRKIASLYNRLQLPGTGPVQQASHGPNGNGKNGNGSHTQSTEFSSS